MPALLLVVPGALLVGMFLLAWTQTHHALVKSHAESGSFWSSLKAQFTLGGNSLIRGFVALANFAVSRFGHTYVVHVTRFFTGINLLVRQTAKAQADAAVETANAVERMTGVVVPREIHKAVAPVRATARAAHREAGRAETKAESVGTALDHYKARTNPQLRHATHAVDVTLPHDIAGLRARNKALEKAREKDASAIDDLEHGAAKTWEWINSHPLSAVTGLFAGAVAVALARLGYGFLRCRSWRNLGRSLTCNDANVLGDLLLAATLVVGTMSLVELAREEQKVVGEAAKIVRGFWEV